MALSIKETLFVGLSDFWARKLRSGITLFSILLGAFTIITVQSMVKGIQESTLAWMHERGGMNRITVSRNWRYDNPRNLNSYLTYSEYKQLTSQVPEAETSSPQIMSHGRVRVSDRSFFSQIAGVLPAYLSEDIWPLDRGRFINRFDVSNNMDVVVIGSTVARNLFSDKDPVGSFLTYEERRFKVIGVLEERFFSMQGGDSGRNMLEYLNRMAFVPISTIINKLSAQDVINTVTIDVESIDDIPHVRERIESFLLQIRQNEPVFSVTSSLDYSSPNETAGTVFAVVFLMIGMISLLVAGIVIMNIMMATIKERTREIGVRMALGANRNDIFFQFMIQTLLFTFVGGGLGVAAGLLLLQEISSMMDIPMTAGVTLVIVTMMVSIGVGIVFGIFPAVKASNLDPVKCLSYE